jgi:hypothetical protein
MKRIVKCAAFAIMVLCAASLSIGSAQATTPGAQHHKHHHHHHHPQHHLPKSAR